MTKVATRSPTPTTPAAPAPPSLATDDRETVTLQEACRLTSLGRTTIEKMIREGQLSDIKPAKLRRRLIRVDELRALVAPTIGPATPVREAA
jgi:excisionase family DNA binding protein